MSIKLIAVDIDGTLVNSQKEITPEVFLPSKMPKKLVSKSWLQLAAPSQVLPNFWTTCSWETKVTMWWPSMVPLSKKLLLAMRLSANPWPMRIIWIWNSSVASSVSTCMPLPRTVSILQIAISENTLYTNQPRQHAYLLPYPWRNGWQRNC